MSHIVCSIDILEIVHVVIEGRKILNQLKIKCAPIPESIQKEFEDGFRIYQEHLILNKLTIQQYGDAMAKIDDVMGEDEVCGIFDLICDILCTCPIYITEI